MDVIWYLRRTCVRSPKYEYMVRADTLSGWETAAVLREYLFPYIAYELEAISSTGAPGDGV